MNTTARGFSGLEKVLLVSALIAVAAGLWYFVQVRGATTVAETITSNESLELGLKIHLPFDGEHMDWNNTTAEVRNRASSAYSADAVSLTGENMVPGVLGQAIRFTGGSTNPDKVVGTQYALWDFSQRTISAWLYLTDTSFAYVYANSDVTLLGAANGKVFLYKNFLTVNDGQWNSPDVPLNEWFHVVVAYDESSAANQPTFYINGEPAVHTVVTTPSGGARPDSGTYYLGRAIGNTAGLPGSIDDFRMYDRLLSADEVRRLYELGATTKIAQTLTTNPDLDEGLVGHWTFDGSDVDWSSTSAEIRDRSGNQRHGNALGGMDSTSATLGVLGQGLHFDGDDLIDSPATLDLGGSNQVTVGAWVRNMSPTIPHNQGIVYKQTAVYELFLDGSSRIGTWIDNDTVWHAAVYSPSYSDWDEWHHVVSVYDGSTVTLYRDGEAVAVSGSETGNLAASAQPVRIGYNSGGGTNYWNGDMDDVRIYDRALSADEVRRLYELGATTKIAQTLNTNPDLDDGLVGHWTFDGPDMDWSSTTAEIADKSGLRNHGNALLGSMGKQSVTLGVIGQALRCDGNDLVRATCDACKPTIPYTIALWFNTPNIARNQLLWGYKSPSDGSWGRSAVFTGDYLHAGGYGIALNGIPRSRFNSNEWYHISAIYTSGDVQVFVNGVNETVYSGDYWNNSNNLEICSRSSGGTSYPFIGSLDDVRIYNRALSADEVRRLYEMGQ